MLPRTETQQPLQRPHRKQLEIPEMLSVLYKPGMTVASKPQQALRKLLGCGLLRGVGRTLSRPDWASPSVWMQGKRPRRRRGLGSQPTSGKTADAGEHTKRKMIDDAGHPESLENLFRAIILMK